MRRRDTAALAAWMDGERRVFTPTLFASLLISHHITNMTYIFVSYLCEVRGEIA